MKMFRVFFKGRDGNKRYLCYSLGIGSHWSNNPGNCSVRTKEQAEKSANWNARYCGNVDGECQIEEYEENRSLSIHEKSGDILASEWVKYERDYFYWHPLDV